MNIVKNFDNSVLTLRLEGKLNAITSPMLSDVVEKELSGVTQLIFDFEALEYISSAGLRVVLTAQDIMDEQGTMKLIHVSDSVMEILDVTGLVDLLTIE